MSNSRHLLALFFGWKMGLATSHLCSLLSDAHPFRSPRGHLQSLKVAAALFFSCTFPFVNKFPRLCTTKKALLLQGFQTSGGRWGCCSPIKILTTSIYRPFQPLFFTIWSHIGLRKIVLCICKYNDSS